MIPNAISTTQPAIGHSYTAYLCKPGRRVRKSIVYRGFEAGKYIIYDGTNQYRAERVSSDDTEPVFQFKESDIVVE